MYKYVFGPVPSRRLGISLGVDMVKAKTCNFNCVYCECGETKEYKKDRKKYIDVEILKIELAKVLSTLRPNYITFSGNGEPTLNSDLGEIVRWIKERYNIKTALITNASLLYKEDVLEEVMLFDLIIPTLNTVTEEIFQKINRASEECSVDNIKKGISKLSKIFKGMIYIEFFVIEGINDNAEELEKYLEFLKTIKFTKLQLNSLARPGAEKWVKPVGVNKLEEIKKFFNDAGIENVEIVSAFKEIEKKIDPDKNLIENMKEKREYDEEEMKKIYNI